MSVITNEALQSASEPTFTLSPFTFTSISRDEFGACGAPDWVKTIMRELEGRAWTTGIERLNNRGGFEAINADCYGYATFMEQPLCVVQLRRAYRKKEKHFTSLRKDYYLCGRNENGLAFAHPVKSARRSKRAMASAEGAVYHALADIWGCPIDDLPDIRRNGDVAFVPISVRSFPAVESCESLSSVELAGSHVVTPGAGAQLVRDPAGKIFGAGRLKLSHSKGQHPTAVTESSHWRIVIAERFAHWGFTQPTAD